MPLKLVPATFSDLPKIAQIEEASFASNPLTPIFFPGDKTAETDDAYVESLATMVRDRLGPGRLRLGHGCLLGGRRQRRRKLGHEPAIGEPVSIGACGTVGSSTEVFVKPNPTT